GCGRLSRARSVELSGLGIRLGFVPLGDLRQHEEVLDEDVRSLAGRMASDGVQLDPIVVDSSTLTVLDGAHRVAALGRLGARWAAAALVEYRDPGIRVGRWLRSLDPRDAVRGVVGMDGVGSAREAMSLVDSSGPRAAVLMPTPPSYVSPPLPGCLEAHRLARRVWGPSAAAQLVPDQGVDAALSSGRAVVYPTAPSKADVLRAASSGELFPPKSTRHILRARPLGLDAPLGLLSSDEPALEFLEAAASRARLLPPGSEFRGSVREEAVVALGDGRCPPWPSRAPRAAARSPMDGRQAASSRSCRAA
ncbi:MAG: hypothetical protein ACP5NG_04740, partial [Conexivisphaera sp.]